MSVRDTRLTGLNPLAYVGVNAGSPPNIREYQRAPTTNDKKNFIIGDFWLDTNASPQNLWILVSLSGGTATWLELTPGTYAASFPTDSGTATPVAGVLNVVGGTNANTAGSGNTVTINSTTATDVATTYNADTGSATPAANALTVAGGTSIDTSGAGSTLTVDAGADLANSYVTDSGTATPAANVLNVLGGENMNTAGAGDTATINLNRVIRWPETNAAGTEGVIYLDATVSGTGGKRFLHAYDPGTTENNIFLGIEAGNFTLTGDQNTMIGWKAGESLTSGAANVGIGDEALTAATTANSNTGVGDDVFKLLTTGELNTAIGPDRAFNLGGGKGAGSNYTTESHNICICNNGTVGDANTMRLGTHGNGDAQQDKCFIAGVRGITTGVADAVAVLIDSAYQLGTVSSTIRSKQNVADMTTEGDDVLNLRPVTFEYKEHPGIKQYGLIAEEVKEVLPRLVVNDDDGKPLTVQYHVLPSLLLDAVKKLSKRVDELEAKLEGQK